MRKNLLINITSLICILFFHNSLYAQNELRNAIPRKTNISYDLLYFKDSILIKNVHKNVIQGVINDTTVRISFYDTLTKTYNFPAYDHYSMDMTLSTGYCQYLKRNEEVIYTSAGSFFNAPNPMSYFYKLYPYIVWRDTIRNIFVGISSSESTTTATISQGVSYSFPHIQPDTEKINHNKFRRIYEFSVFQFHRRFLYISANFTPSVSFRSNKINETQFIHVTDQQTRAIAESTNFGYNANCKIGISFNSKASRYQHVHTIYAAFIAKRQGFVSDSTGSVNWKTGIDTGNATSQEYRFYNTGLGIGYNYTSYQHIIGPCFDVQLYYTWLDKFSTNQEDYYKAQVLKSLGLRVHQMGAQIATGISIMPQYGWEFHILPVFDFNLSSVNKATILRTNLYDFGLMCGVTHRFIKHHYKKV